MDNTFVEDGDPVTSSVKRLPLTLPMRDVMKQNDHRTGTSSDPPPTLVVSELISLLVAPKASASGTGETTAWEEPYFNDDTLARLERIFMSRATGKDGNGKAVMTYENVKEWLTVINGQVGRGDEFREAARQMGWKAPVNADDDDDDDSSPDEKSIIVLPPDGVLTLEGFTNVYLRELRSGKFWGIAHDFAVLNEPLPITELYKARYDRMYASAAVKAVAVMDFVSSRPCPNDTEPSDHLPIAAAFELQG